MSAILWLTRREICSISWMFVFFFPNSSAIYTRVPKREIIACVQQQRCNKKGFLTGIIKTLVTQILYVVYLFILFARYAAVAWGRSSSLGSTSQLAFVTLSPDDIPRPSP